MQELKPRFEKFCDLQLSRSVLVALLRESSASGSAFEDCVATVSGKRAELSFFCLLRAYCSPNLFQFWLGFCVSSAGTFSLRFAEYLFSFMVHVMWLDLRGMPHAHFELVSEVDPVRFNLRTPELALISPKCKSSASQGWTA